MPPMNCSMKKGVVGKNVYHLCISILCNSVSMERKVLLGKKLGIFYEKKGFVGKKFFQRMRCVCAMHNV